MTDLAFSVSGTDNGAGDLFERLAKSIDQLVDKLDKFDGVTATAKADVDAKPAEAALDGVEKHAKEAGENAGEGLSSGFAAKVAGIAAAGTAIGTALVGAIGAAMDKENSSAKLAAQLGGTSDVAEKYGKIAGDLYSNNFGDSLDTVNDALVQVHRNIGETFEGSDAEITAITGNVLSLADAFGIDVAGATASVGQMLKTGLEPNAQSALDVIAVGFQQGVDKAGDFLDTLNEYSGVFQKFGIDGAQATGLLSQGLKAGARDSDLVADAFKEFSLRAVTGSTEAGAAFASLGLDGAKMTQIFAKGGPEAGAALDTVVDAINAMTDPVARNTAGVALFGTQFEDLGPAFKGLDPSSATDSLGKVAGAAQKVSDTLGDTASGKIESFKRTLQTGLVDFIGGSVLPMFETVAGWGSSLFGEAWGPVRDFLGFLAGTGGVVIAVIGGIAVATWAWTAAGAALSAATLPITGTMLLIIGGIVLLVGAIIYAWNHFDGFRNVVITVWDAVKTAFQVGVDVVVNVFNAIVDAVTNVGQFFHDVWTNVASFVTGVWNGIGDAATAIWGGIVGFITGVWTTARDVAVNVWTAVGDFFTGLWNGVRDITMSVWNAISGFFSGIWNFITGLVSTVWNAITDYFTRLFHAHEELIMGVWNGITGFLSMVWNAISSTASAVWNAVASFFTMIWTAISDTVTNVWNAIVGFLTTAWNVFSAAWSLMWTTISTVFTTIWNAISSFVVSIWNTIAAFFTQAWAVLSAAWNAMWSAISALFSTIWNAIMAVATAIWNQIAAFFSGAWAVFSAAWQAVWNAVSGVFSTVWNAISGVATTVWNAIASFFTGALNTFVGFFSGIWNGIVADFQRIWGGITDIAKSIWDGVQSVFKTGVNGAIDVINWLKDKVNVVLEFLLIPRIPDIPKMEAGGMLGVQLLAAGGKVGAGFMTNGPQAIVGEGNQAHPEFVIPTDPKYRGNALALYKKLGDQLIGSRLLEGGGVLDWLGNAASNVWGGITSAASSVGDAIGTAASWAVGSVDKLVGDIMAAIHTMVGPGMFGDATVAIAKNAVDGIVKMIQDALVKMGTVGLPGTPGMEAGLAWARTQAGKPYVWGGGGSPGWDCSGFIGGVTNVIRGLPPARIGTTMSMPWPGFAAGSTGAFVVGNTNAGVGHMAATLLGVNIETQGSLGTVIGPGARGAMDSLFGEHYVFTAANGGIVTQPTFGLVGEAGPEVILPLSRPGRTAALMSQAGLGTPGGVGNGDTSGVEARLDALLAAVAKGGLGTTVNVHGTDDPAANGRAVMLNLRLA